MRNIFLISKFITIIFLIQTTKEEQNLKKEIVNDIKEISKVNNNKEKLVKNSQNSDLLAGDCNFNTCPLGKGTCFEGNCICDIGYTTLPNDKISCEYEQRDHSVAFFLEFFFPLGAGHFYAEQMLYGLVKSVLFILLCLFWCGDICNLRIRFTLNSKWDKIHMGSVLVNFIAFTLMHLIDLICFGFNIYKDGNGIDLI
jgi:hypothetical protein